MKCGTPELKQKKWVTPFLLFEVPNFSNLYFEKEEEG
jgi:hypothetical protein